MISSVASRPEATRPCWDCMCQEWASPRSKNAQCASRISRKGTKLRMMPCSHSFHERCIFSDGSVLAAFAHAAALHCPPLMSNVCWMSKQHVQQWMIIDQFSSLFSVYPHWQIVANSLTIWFQLTRTSKKFFKYSVIQCKVRQEFSSCFMSTNGFAVSQIVLLQL